MNEILAADNVTYLYSTRYRKVEALKEVNCSFETGRFSAIVGPSGSGKTTLLSLLAGLDVPTKGEILFQGTSTRQLDRSLYRRAKCSVIYQSFNLFPLLTALENVMYPMELSKMNKAQAALRAKELINSVGLPDDIYRQFPKMMSGGEQQRIAIARALSTQSEVILADEPTGNLDSENGIKVIDLLKELAHKENKCVVVITHDLAIANEADTVYEIRDGICKNKI